MLVLYYTGFFVGWSSGGKGNVMGGEEYMILVFCIN